MKEKDDENGFLSMMRRKWGFSFVLRPQGQEKLVLKTKKKLLLHLILSLSDCSE
jgi:hypothetical protein